MANEKQALVIAYLLAKEKIELLLAVIQAYKPPSVFRKNQVMSLENILPQG